MVLLAETHDLDICNSVFTLLSQLVKRLEVTPALPKALGSVLTRLAESRDEICSTELNISKAEGKQLLVSILYGGAVPQKFQSNPLLTDLSKVSLYLRWLAISLLDEEFARFRSPAVSKKNPDMSILSHLYLSIEDLVLTSWCRYLQALHPAHLSLHFDGVRVSPIESMSVEELCKESAAHIAKETGFVVVIREKRHRTVLQNIQHVATREPKLSTGEAPVPIDHGLKDADKAALLNLEASGAKRPASSIERPAVARKDWEPRSANRPALHLAAVGPSIEIHGSQSEPEIFDVLSDSGPDVDALTAADTDFETIPLSWVDDDGLVITDRTLLQDLAKEVKSVWPRFMLDAVRAGSALVNLLPSRTSRWWPLIEDVFMSDKAIELRNTILAECVAHGEFTAISIDGTFRVCLSIMGQLPFNMSKELRQKAAFKDDESIRRVITVRGKTGAVVAMFGAPGEGAADLRRGLENNLPTAALHQIQYLATDAPSVKLLEELKETLPNLEGISLDPVHLAMHYESASARKKTAGSATLRKCLAKFGHSKSMPPPATWGAFFTGAEDGQLSARERVLRDQIVDGSMAQTKARKILESLDAVTYWPTRTCFIETLAAISAVYRAEVTKKSDEGKPLTDLLWNAQAYGRWTTGKGGPAKAKPKLACP
ncbi:Uncharacterized protein SCF082_LOCUS43912 [Durusdinium trenchii]|uniref:Uncharacterized protein n=1 Tax=Durusdinium trenchii TaxID=1381693 RepID=A0ABP0QZQ1_9DINO